MKPDIIFRIFDGSDALLGEVSAHKFILGLSSPVFKKSFFGVESADKTAKSLNIDDTTVEAFELFIEFIYDVALVKKDLVYKMTDLKAIFDVAYLAQKYEVASLHSALESVIKKLTITMENIVDIASTALNYSRFPIESEALFLHCATFLSKAFKTSDSKLQFAGDLLGFAGDAEVCLKLLGKIKEIQCLNCGYGTTNCRDGSTITAEDVKNLVIGANVRGNVALDYNNSSHKRCRGLNGIVQSNDANEVAVDFEDGTRTIPYNMKDNFNVHILIFNC